MLSSSSCTEERIKKRLILLLDCSVDYLPRRVLNFYCNSLELLRKKHASFNPEAENPEELVHAEHLRILHRAKSML
jgi:hypothetical protein